MERYDPHAIEPKWQQVWEEAGAFAVPNPDPGTPPNPDKRYVLEQLPYPSGTLHMGHMLVYTIGDVRSHFQRRTGHEVMRPMGWDSFGLPAENAAIRGGGHPREMTERNIDHIRAFMKRAGWAIDWDGGIAARTGRLLPLDAVAVPEAVRGRPGLPQSVAGELVPNNQRSWPTSRSRTAAASAQGRSSRPGTWSNGSSVRPRTPTRCSTSRACSGPTGSSRCSGTGSAAPKAPADLPASDGLDIDIPVFTTRPDTVFGATFFVLAPEHELVPKLAAGTYRRTRCWSTSGWRPAAPPTGSTPTARRPASSPAATP